jgi:hypothetical protein
MALVNIVMSFIALQNVTKLHAIEIEEQDVNMRQNLHCMLVNKCLV